jgi:hypothetical protein
MTPFSLSRNAFGRLVFTPGDGTGAVEDVALVRAFPIAAPEHGIAIVSPEGRELVWIDALAELDPALRSVIEGELARREFLPEIRRIRHVSGYATPSTWQVDTDRGATGFVLNGEEDIRRIGASTLLIADSHGLQFLIRDMAALDKTSRRLLDRFL